MRKKIFVILMDLIIFSDCGNKSDSITSNTQDVETASPENME